MAKAEPQVTDTHAGAVTVLLPPKIANSFERVLEIQKAVLERTGHPGCYSNRDFLFRYVRDEIYVATERGVVSALHG